MSEERVKLANKLRDLHQKVLATRSKNSLSEFLENPLLLVDKQVMHIYIKDSSQQPKWFDATVQYLVDILDGADTFNAEHNIKCNTGEDETEWTMPLVKDSDKRI